MEHSAECRETQLKWKNACYAVTMAEREYPRPNNLGELMLARQESGEAFEKAQISCPADPLYKNQTESNECSDCLEDLSDCSCDSMETEGAEDSAREESDRQFMDCEK